MEKEKNEEQRKGLFSAKPIADTADGDVAAGGGAGVYVQLCADVWSDSGI